MIAKTGCRRCHNLRKAEKALRTYSILLKPLLVGDGFSSYVRIANSEESRLTV